MPPITPIQKRVRLLFGLKLAILFAAITVGLVSVNKLRTDADWVSHTHEVKSKVNEVEANIYRNSAATRGYVITHDPAQAGIAQQTWDEISRLLAEVQSLTEDNPVQQDWVKRMRVAIDVRKDISVRILAAKTPEDASKIITNPETQNNLDDIHSIYNSMIAHENHLLEVRFKKMERTTFEADVAMPIFLVPSIALLIGMFVIVNQYVENCNKDSFSS